MADVVSRDSVGSPMFVHLPMELDIASLLHGEEQGSLPCVQWQPGALLRALCRVPPITGVSCPPNVGPPHFPPRAAFAGREHCEVQNSQQKALIKLAPSRLEQADVETSEPKAPNGLMRSDIEQSDMDGSAKQSGGKPVPQGDCFNSVSGAQQQPWGDRDPDDETRLEEALLPVLRHMLIRESPRKAQGGSGNNGRWWTRPTTPLLCPLSRFPICLLPYPPFKLRVDPKRPSPHRLVDGKFLAMSLAVSGSFTVCGRQLQASELNALGEYVHRCKLGPYRPARAAELRERAESAPTAEDREKASEELNTFIELAKVEMAKLRRIQDNRVAHINKSLPHDLQVLLKAPDMNTDSEYQPIKKRTTEIRNRRSSLASDSTRCSSSASDVTQD